MVTLVDESGQWDVAHATKQQTSLFHSQHSFSGPHTIPSPTMSCRLFFGHASCTPPRSSH